MKFNQRIQGQIGNGQNIFLVTTLAVIVGLFLLASLSGEAPKQDVGQLQRQIDATEKRVPPPSVASPALAPSLEKSEMLSDMDVAKLLSNYMNEINAILQVYGYAQSMYLSKAQQDMQFRDLDKLRSDAESLKELSLKTQEKINAAFSLPDLNERQEKVVGDVLEAGDNLGASITALPVDISVYAHTGVAMNSEIEKDVNEFRAAKAQLASAMKKAYKALGITQKSYDSKTLVLK